jgi:hypothetical protein
MLVSMFLEEGQGFFIDLRKFNLLLEVFDLQELIKTANFLNCSRFLSLRMINLSRSLRMAMMLFSQLRICLHAGLLAVDKEGDKADLVEDIGVVLMEGKLQEVDEFLPSPG